MAISGVDVSHIVNIPALVIISPTDIEPLNAGSLVIVIIFGKKAYLGVGE
jgi:hypothetical protein